MMMMMILYTRYTTIYSSCHLHPHHIHSYSQHLYEAANAAGVFDLEITEIEIKGMRLIYVLVDRGEWMNEWMDNLMDELMNMDR